MFEFNALQRFAQRLMVMANGLFLAATEWQRKVCICFLSIVVWAHLYRKDKNKPVMIWIIKHAPNKDPKFHSNLIILGIIALIELLRRDNIGFIEYLPYSSTVRLLLLAYTETLRGQWTYQYKYKYECTNQMIVRHDFVISIKSACVHILTM